MGKLVERLQACLLELEAHHNGVDGWRPSGQATPYLYLLYNKGRDGVTANDVRLEPWVWGMNRTLGGFLHRSADLISQHQGMTSKLIRPDMIGVGVVCEGWALGTDEAEDVERVARERRIHQHVNRRENRIVLGTLMAGSTVYSVIRFRRQNEIIALPDNEREATLEGAIPEGLRYMADTLLMVSSMGGTHVRPGIVF